MTAQGSPSTLDTHHLTRTVTNDGVVYQSEGRAYRVEPSSTAARITLSIEVEGSPAPRVESVSTHSAKKRRELGERLAGDLHPELAVRYEQDFLQIVEQESEARDRDTDRSGEGDRVVIARFDGLIDLVRQGPNVAFLLKSPDGRVEVVQETIRPPDSFSAPRILVPPRADQLPFLVPDYDDVLAALGKDSRELWDDVGQWITSCSVPPTGYLDLQVSFAFHTHVADRCTHSPILLLAGPPEHGKTRQGKSIVYVAHRGVWTEMPHEAHILDLWDAWGSIQREGIEDVMMHRFERGAKIPRVNKFDAGPFADTRYYEVYGPTIVGSNTTPPPVLMSRCLPIPMRQSTVKPPRYPEEVDALPLRAALIAWRANTFGVPFPTVSCGLTGRLGDLARPLLQVTQLVAPDRLEQVVAALDAMPDQRHQRNAETWEGRIVSSLLTLAGQVQNGLLSLKVLCEKVNEGYGKALWRTERQVGDVLRLLGFKTRVYGKERRAHVDYDTGLVKDLVASLLGGGGSV